MNREIKFRAWDGLAETMIYWDELIYPKNKHRSLLNLLVNLPQDHKSILMQYTGLKDKNGKEIYEGDIVRMLYTDWPSQCPNAEGRFEFSVEDYMKSISKNGVVVYRLDRYCLEFEDKHGNYYDHILEGAHGEKEIIGNIYQNPELLRS